MNSMVRNLVPLGKRTYKKRAPKTKVKSNATLTKKVNMLSRKANAGAETIYISKVLTGATFTGPVTSINLMDYVNFAPIFGTAITDYSLVNKLEHKSCSLDFKFDMNNELHNIDVTCMLIQLTGLANNTYDKTTGVLTIPATTGYYIPSGALASLVRLNPKMYKVLKSKRFVLGNNNSAYNVSTSDACQKSTQYFRWNFKIDKNIASAIGNVQQQYASQSPTNQYYVLIFNNDSTADGYSPIFNFMCIHKMVTPA